MGEQRCSTRGKHEVGSTRQIANMQAVAQAPGMQTLA